MHAHAQSLTGIASSVLNLSDRRWFCSTLLREHVRMVCSMTAACHCILVMHAMPLCPYRCRQLQAAALGGSRYDR